MTEPTSPTSPYPSPAVQRSVLIVAVLGAAVVFVDSSVANIALPAIQRDLGLTTAMQQWAASAFLLTLSVFLLPGGRLSDFFGRRRMFLIGLAAYAACSIAAALAPNGATLIGARALGGLAGAILAPTTLALVNANFPPDRRGQAIGTWSGWSGIATLLGPVIAGIMIDRASWRLAFGVSPLVALIALGLAFAFRIPESCGDPEERHIDWAGVGLLVVSLGSIVFALIEAPVIGWGAPLVLGTLVGGVVLLPVFVWWETRARAPLLPLGMFADRNLGTANLVTFFVYAALYGMSFYTALYLQTSLGVSAVIAGGIFIPVTIILFVLSPIAGRLNDRRGPKWLLVYGPLTAAVGLVFISFIGTPQQVWTLGLPGIILFGIGMGFSVAPVTTTAIGAAPPKYTGAASGFNNAVSRIAGLMAIAIMGVVIVSLWHAGLRVASNDANYRVKLELSRVEQTAFVIPELRGREVGFVNEIQGRARTAARSAFRNGMWLAAALMVFGALTSLAFMRPAAMAYDSRDALGSPQPVESDPDGPVDAERLG